MKKSLVFMIAVLLVGALMISCSGDVSNNSDNLATVSLKTDTSKGLNTVTGSLIKDIDELYWYFTATKTDGSIFRTGEAPDKTQVVSGKGLRDQYIGGENSKRLFSTGSWSFSFYGYETADTSGNLVYKCENLAVTITDNTELTLTLDTASDSPAQLILATDDAPYWTYGYAKSGTSLTLKIYEGSTLLATSTGAVDNNHKASFSQLKVNDVNADYVELTAGIHNLNFEVWYGVEKVGESALNLNAKANTSYSVTGDIAVLDSTFWVHINSVTTSTAEIDSTSPKEAVMSVQISPLSATTGASGTSTTVNFADASGVEPAAGTTYSLAVDVLAGTGVSVSASSENVNVANIDLTLTKTTSTGVENVTSFAGSGDGFVLVTTYIGKDLTNVKVEGVAANNGTSDSNADSGISEVTYTPTTGALSFKTTHFSEFAVTSDAVATIEKENSTVFYSTLASAFDAAETGDTITLYANSATSVSYTVPAGKTLTVDFNGNTVTSSKVTSTVGDAGFLVNNGTLTFTDSTTGASVGGVVSSNNNIVINNGTMTINKGSFKGNRNDITYANRNNNTRGVIYNSQAGNLTINSIELYTAQDYGLLNMGTVKINNGRFDSDSVYRKVDTVEMMYGYCVTSYAGTMTINNANVTGVHGLIGVNGGVATINNVTTSFNSGSSYYALYVAGEVGTPVATVNGGSFAKGSGGNSLYVGNRNDGGAGNLAMVTVAGGSFEGNFYYSGVASAYGDGRLEITGGSFSMNPYPNVNHETHEVWKDNSSQYIVVEKNASHNGYDTQVSN